MLKVQIVTVIEMESEVIMGYNVGNNAHPSCAVDMRGYGPRGSCYEWPGRKASSFRK